MAPRVRITELMEQHGLTEWEVRMYAVLVAFLVSMAVIESITNPNYQAGGGWVIMSTTTAGLLVWMLYAWTRR